MDCKVTIFFINLRNKVNSNDITMLSTILIFLGGLRSGEVIIIALVILLLFGGRKIPELMRGLGKGVRSFRQGMKEVSDEIKEDTDKQN